MYVEKDSETVADYGQHQMVVAPTPVNKFVKSIHVIFGEVPVFERNLTWLHRFLTVIALAI